MSVMLTAPSPSGTVADSIDIAALRRRLTLVHDELRSRGYNPLQALRLLADSLLSGGPPAIGLDLERLDRVDGAALAAASFQSFLAQDLRGPFGQYLTPPPVARHVAELLVACGSTSGPVMDPFLGSGILLDAVARLLPRHPLLGFEINDSVAHVAKAAVAMAGHEVDVQIADSIKLWVRGDLPEVGAIATNPPFGAHAPALDTPSTSHTLTARCLGTRRAPLELLALELCMDCLSPGGHLSIVLPQSVLTNSRFAGFRSEFFRLYRLLHVTSLPEATFAPFRGVAKACVLLVKKERPRSSSYPLSYATSRSVGYDDTGRVAMDSDLGKIVDGYRRRTLPEAWLEGGSPVLARRAGSAGGMRDVHRLGDIAEVFRGKNPARDAYIEDGPFLLKVGSLSGSFITWRDRDRSKVPVEWFAKNQHKHLRPGDLCFTASAHRPRYIGRKVDLVTTLPPQGAMPSGEVMVIRLKEDAPFPPEALLLYLRSSFGYDSLQSFVKGSTAHVYASDLSDMTIPDLSRLFDVDRVVQLHAEADAAFNRYLRLEDEAIAVAGLPGIGKNVEE